MHASLARLIHLLVTDNLFRAELQTDFAAALSCRNLAATEENMLALKAALKETGTCSTWTEGGGDSGDEFIGWAVSSHHYISVALNGA